MEGNRLLHAPPNVHQHAKTWSLIAKSVVMSVTNASVQGVKYREVNTTEHALTGVNVAALVEFD